MSVKLIRLLSGEELIGKEPDDIKADGYIILDEVLLVGYQMQQNHTMQFGFGPFSPMCKPGPKYINRDLIVFVSEPNDVLLQGYNQFTGRIVTPTKEILPAKELIIG
jgi:hypothetical protein